MVLAENDLIRKEDLELSGCTESGESILQAHIPVNAEELKNMKRDIRGQAIESLEKSFLISALKRNNWNVTRAAEETGILRPNFQGMLKRQGISIKDQGEK